MRACTLESHPTPLEWGKGSAIDPFGGSGWPPGLPRDLHAERRLFFSFFTSAEHKRASTRVSFFALVSFGPRGSLRVAKVESLLRVRELPGDCELGPDGHLVPLPPPAVLRLAVCSVYSRQGMQEK